MKPLVYCRCTSWSSVGTEGVFAAPSGPSMYHFEQSSGLKLALLTCHKISLDRNLEDENFDFTSHIY